MCAPVPVSLFYILIVSVIFLEEKQKKPQTNNNKKNPQIFAHFCLWNGRICCISTSSVGGNAEFGAFELLGGQKKWADMLQYTSFSDMIQLLTSLICCNEFVTHGLPISHSLRATDRWCKWQSWLQWHYTVVGNAVVLVVMWLFFDQ